MAGVKEKNFVSAVVYLHNDADRVKGFLTMLADVLRENFEQYEIVCVDDASTDQTAESVRLFAADRAEKPLTLLHTGLQQGPEKCMNAGQDMAIGDYVFEFDTLQQPYEPEMILQAYKTALQGNDIVTVGPKEGDGGIFSGRKLFYSLFNRCSSSRYPIGTDAFYLLSRRAINRVHAQSGNIYYRKAAYAACGLKMERLTFAGALQKKKGGFDLAIDSLALYTDAGYRASLAVTLAMLLLAVCELLYTLAIFIGGRFVEGWVTMMFVLTVGLAGLFLVLTIVIKYLSLLLKLEFTRQQYLIESVEKFQK